MAVQHSIAAALLLAGLPLLARASPPGPDHPIVGTWTLTLGNTPCMETYEFRADGTSRVTSGFEQVTTEYDVSNTLTADGYYELLDTITSSNGKPDCTGNVTPVGDRSKIFLRPQRSGMLMCVDATLSNCVGLLVKQVGAGSSRRK